MNRQGFMSTAAFDYAATFLLTIVASAVNMLIVAVLARVLPESGFLDFSLVQRYFGFLAIAANLAVGFALIQLSKDTDFPVTQAIAKLCRWLVSGWSMVLFLGWVGFVAWFKPFHESSLLIMACVFMWVVTQAQYHVSAPYSRKLGGVKQFLSLFAVAKIVASVAGLICVLVYDEFWVWFVGYTVVSQVYQWNMWRSNSAAAKLDVAREVWNFSSTRWIEGMLRTGLPLVFILLCQRQFGHQTAGYVAVVYAFVKTLESVLQPLVISIMMRRTANDPGRLLIWLTMIFTLVLCVAIYFSKGFIEFAFGLLLGENYYHLTQYAWVALFSSGALVSLNLLRAKYDNDFRYSPLLVINLVCIIAVFILMPFCQSVADVVALIVGVHFARWLSYIIVLLYTTKMRSGGDAPVTPDL